MASATVRALRANDTAADRVARGTWRADIHYGLPGRLTQGPHDTAPAWSPDGTRLAFLRAREGQPPQIWLLPAAGGEAERPTDLPVVGGACWSET